MKRRNVISNSTLQDGVRYVTSINSKRAFLSVNAASKKFKEAFITQYLQLLSNFCLNIVILRMKNL